MTREEAIAILKNRDMHGVPCGYTSGYSEALDMAIEALSEPRIVRCKDCRHRFYDKYNDCFMCEKHEYGESFEDDDFCSWGERREK